MSDNTKLREALGQLLAGNWAIGSWFGGDFCENQRATEMVISALNAALEKEAADERQGSDRKGDCLRYGDRRNTGRDCPQNIGRHAGADSEDG